jgi:hypothetical protein
MGNSDAGHCGLMDCNAGVRLSVECALDEATFVLQ